MAASCGVIGCNSGDLNLPPEPSYNGKTLSAWIADASAVADDQDPSLHAVQAMGGVALPHLLQAFKTGELLSAPKPRKLQVWDVRAKTAEIIKGLGTNASPLAPAVTEYLTHSEQRVREEAAEILGYTGVLSDKILHALLRALSDPECAFEASRALARLGKSHPSVVQELARIAAGRDRAAAAWATVALEYLGPKSAPVLPVLVRLTGDESFDTRLSAIRALGLIQAKDEASIRALTKALGDREVWVRKCAVIALGRIGPAARASVNDLKALLAANEPAYTRADIARTLWRLEPEEPQRPLQIAEGLIEEGLDSVRRRDGIPYALTSALFLLAEMGTNAMRALPVVMRAQQVSEPVVRFNAAWAAYHIDPGKRNATEALLQRIAMLENYPVDPKLQSGGPIGQILAGPKRERESYHVRLAALGALWRLDPRWQTELSDDFVNLLKQWTKWTALKSPIPEQEVLVPVLQNILSDSSMADVHPYAAMALEEVTGTAGERW